MITKYIEKTQLVVGVLCLSVFIIAILMQVFARYLGIPLMWAEEVANFSFIWSVFMGASVMLNRKAHFKFGGISEKLTGTPKFILDTIVNGIVLTFTLFVAYYGVSVVQHFWNYRWITIPNMKMGYVWLCVPIMGITMSIYIISHIMEDINRFRRKEYQ
ncbi:MAG: TRAP transporter small permease subunit [Thermotaleaceae bacterium]